MNRVEALARQALASFELVRQVYADNEGG